MNGDYSFDAPDSGTDTVFPESTSPFEMDDVIELEDGSAEVLINETESPSSFYDNLAETLPPQDLEGIASKLLDLIEKDKKAREKRDKQYEDGLRRTGLGDDAPGGAQFNGASRVVHPILAEAAIDFAARAIKELCPPKGPVKSHIVGKSDDSEVELAERKVRGMNWQLTSQIREYRTELEQMLTQVPMGGSQYLKIWHDAKLKRHRVEFVPIDNVFLPFSAVSFYESQRITHKQDITRSTFDQRVKSGYYKDISIADPEYPDQSASEKANDKIEGRVEDAYNDDGLRTVYEIQVNHSFQGDSISKGETVPYVIIIDEHSENVLGVYRNWDESDETYSKLEWMVEFPFIPWRGAYAVGLPHLIGGISAALTGALRALLDSAHINNAASMLKLKSGRMVGQNTQVEVTQVTEIEAPTGVTDIRQIAMPMPFNPPSPVLFQLLGFLTDVGKGVVTTAEEKIADASNNMPVGTALALIEQGGQVFSAIHQRLHYAQQRVFDILSRLNKQYPYVIEQMSEAIGEQLTVEDFEDDSNIQPVSDPNIFSESQRYAQIQAVLSMSQDKSVQWDMNRIYRMALKLMKFDAVDEILPELPIPKRSDPIDENVKATKGLPLSAFMEQDHVAHLYAHLIFATSPIYGANPMLAQPTVSILLEHCKEHMAMFYSRHAKAAMGAIDEIAKIQGGEGQSEVHKAIALADQQIAIKLQKIMPMLQQAQQIAMQTAPKPQLDPQNQVALQLGQAEIQRKAQYDQANLQMKAAEFQANQQIAMLEKRAEEMQQRFENQLRLTEQEAQRRADELAQQVEILKNDADNKQHQMTELLKNHEDNQTEMMIAKIREENEKLRAETADRDAQYADILKNTQDNLTRIFIEEMKTGIVSLNNQVEQRMNSLEAQLQPLVTKDAESPIMAMLKRLALPKTVKKNVIRDQKGNVVGVEEVQQGAGEIIVKDNSNV